ncbi:MAG: SOS response-associated peptidase [Halobacteriaceae archaeon]
MCGRTSLFTPQPDLERRFDATAVDPLEPRYNIAPGEDLAVITNEAPEEISQFEWGLVPHWVDDPSAWSPRINARSESLTERASFRDAVEKRRCLVLADGFYEWQGDRGSKRPYRVALADDAPFAFAGLWETWEGEDETRQTVTILTTDANEVVSPIHDRMPVMLEPDEEAAWLAATDEATRAAVLDPYPPGEVCAYEVSTMVNNPANDSPAVIDPVAGDQSGLDDFSASD